jgi:hypothetical protein
VISAKLLLLLSQLLFPPFLKKAEDTILKLLCLLLELKK